MTAGSATRSAVARRKFPAEIKYITFVDAPITTPSRRKLQGTYVHIYELLLRVEQSKEYLAKAEAKPMPKVAAVATSSRI